MKYVVLIFLAVCMGCDPEIAQVSTTSAADKCTFELMTMNGYDAADPAMTEYGCQFDDNNDIVIFRFGTDGGMHLYHHPVTPAPFYLWKLESSCDVTLYDGSGIDRWTVKNFVLNGNETLSPGTLKSGELTNLADNSSRMFSRCKLDTTPGILW